MIFLDSDDWLQDDAVSVLLDTQLKYPDRLVSTHRYEVYIDDSGKLYRRIPRSILSDTSELSQEQAIKFWFSSACYKIFNTKILRTHNIYFMEGIHNHEDGLFVFEYIHKTDGIIYFNKALWNILNRPSSACHSGYKFNMAESVIKADRIMIDYPDNTPEIRNVLLVRCVECVLGFMRDAVAAKADISEIIYLRNYAAQYAHDYLFSKRVSFPRKIFFLSVFMPVPLMKCTAYLVFFLKIFRDKLIEHMQKSSYEQITESWLQ